LDLGVGQKLTELAKILMSGSLKLLLFLKKKKNKTHGYFENFDRI
jgi:hypothetical protein